MFSATYKVCDCLSTSFCRLSVLYNSTSYQSIDIDLPRKTNSKKVRQANASRYLRYTQFTLGTYSMYFAGFFS